MKIESFEDIIAWQKGIDLAFDIYKLFKANRDFGFKDQIQDAAVSVSNNIAEGFERRSNKELRQFLFISKGSAAEVRSMLTLALRLGYITKQDFDKLYSQCIEIARLLSGFIKTL